MKKKYRKSAKVSPLLTEWEHQKPGARIAGKMNGGYTR
jgi:hypothetical protein